MSDLKTCTGKKPVAFMQLKWVFILISLIFVGLSVYEIAIKGLNFGVDFKGGAKVVAAFESDVTADQVREKMEALNIGDVQVIRFGQDPAKNQLMLRGKYIEGKNVADLMVSTLKKDFQNVTVLSEEVVGPKVGADLQQKGFLSVVFACILIMAYIGFRFDFLFSPGAVAALVHDIVISVGFFSFFGKEFNLPILAALLTILGYSINDTIVIYDRIRENIKRLPKSTSLVEVINISVTETLRRTIVTSLTVLLVVVTLFYLGGGVLHDFAFCLIIGVVFGTYSSIFIAAPIYVWLQKMFPKQGIKAEKQANASAA